jgi:hypothetical protein
VSASPSSADLIADIAGFTQDPLGHVLYVYPWGKEGTELAKDTGPRRWQRETLIEIGERLRAGADLGDVVQKAVASGHGIGKSALIAWICKWALDTFEDCRGIVTANTDTQLRTKTWPELAKWHRLAINRDWFTHTATAMMSTQDGHEKTWRVDAIPWSEHNTEAFAGLHNAGKRVLLLFDESSAIADKVWEVAEGALTDEHTEIIWCAFGNPTRNTGRFHECFGSLKHRWNPKSIDSRTVEGTNKPQIQKWVDDYGEDSDFVRVRVKGEFPRAGSNQFIGSDIVAIAQARKPELPTYQHAARVLGVDIARHGDDETVIIRRQGVHCEAPKRMRVPDLMQIAFHVVEEIEAWKPDAVFIDATGMGFGVIDRLRQLNYGKLIHAVQTGEKAMDEARYYNWRAELWGRTRDWLREAGSLPDDAGLRVDLTAPEYGFDNRGRLQLEKKEDMKARGIASPDSADALCLTFAAKVADRKRLDVPAWQSKLRALKQAKYKTRNPMAV